MSCPFQVPTVTDFKGQFPTRDFPYAVPGFGGAGTAVLTTGAVSGITLTSIGQGYTVPPTVALTGGGGSGATATAQVTAGTITGFTVTAPGTGYTSPPNVVLTGGGGDDTNPEKVQDTDIQTGLDLAGQNFNPGLFGWQADYTRAYCYLAAHFMVLNLRNSMQGVGSSFSWLYGSKGVGGLNAGYVIPDRIRRSPTLSLYSTTDYGARYLSIIMPLLTGNVVSVAGGAGAA